MFLRCPYHLTHNKEHRYTLVRFTRELSKNNHTEKEVPDAVFTVLTESRVSLYFCITCRLTNRNISTSTLSKIKRLFIIFLHRSSEQLV